MGHADATHHAATGGPLAATWSEGTHLRVDPDIAASRDGQRLPSVCPDMRPLGIHGTRGSFPFSIISINQFNIGFPFHPSTRALQSHTDVNSAMSLSGMFRNATQRLERSFSDGFASTFTSFGASRARGAAIGSRKPLPRTD